MNKKSLYDQIKKKCQEDGDCFVWQGNTYNGVPKQSNYSARRIVWEVKKGPIPKGQIMTTTCGNSKCLNVDHLAVVGRSEVSKKSAANPATKARRVISTTKSRRANCKITLEQAMEIRRSTETIFVLADKYGIHKSMVSRIRVGKAWLETPRMASPFAGLLGAR